VAVVDVLAFGVLGIAVLRGLVIGMIREGFSLLALAGAVIGVRLMANPLASWLREDAGVGWSDFSLRVAAGTIVVVGVVGAVVIVGRILRRGVRAAGLGWADRLGGGLLGSAEGLLLVGLILAGALSAIGRDHPALTESRTLAFFDAARHVAQGDDLDRADVAAPPPR